MVLVKSTISTGALGGFCDTNSAGVKPCRPCGVCGWWWEAIGHGLSDSSPRKQCGLELLFAVFAATCGICSYLHATCLYGSAALLFVYAEMASYLSETLGCWATSRKM